MSSVSPTWPIVAVFAALGTLALDRGALDAAADPTELSGAAVDTCWDCKDIACDWCPNPTPCRPAFGYCYEVVRSVSRWCAPQADGLYHRCKWRVDPAGSCVTELLNPCTTENPVCFAPISTCGPLGICIPEGVCPH